MPGYANAAVARVADTVLEICKGLDESLFHRVEGWEALAVAQMLSQQVDEELTAAGAAPHWYENELEGGEPGPEARAVAAAARSYRAARLTMSGKSPGSDARMREEVVSDRAADRIDYYGGMLATVHGVPFAPTLDSARSFMERVRSSQGRPAASLDVDGLREVFAREPVTAATDAIAGAGGMHADAGKPFTGAARTDGAAGGKAFEKGSTMEENTTMGQAGIAQEGAAREFTIKEPNAPASVAQMAFLNDLLAAGVVTADEMSRLGSDPTKQAASDLIGAHSESEGFKAVQAERRAKAAAARGAAKAEKGGAADYAKVKMPAAFLKEHTLTAKDGRQFAKAYVKLPDGVKVNGADLGGFSCDVFLNDRMKQQLLSGEQVTLSFKTSEPVAVWTGKKGDAQHPYQRFEVDAWDLVKGIKAEREEYAAEKAAERAAEKGAGEPGIEDQTGIDAVTQSVTEGARAQYEARASMGGEDRGL